MKLCHMSHIFAFSAIKCIGHYACGIWTMSRAYQDMDRVRSEAPNLSAAIGMYSSTVNGLTRLRRLSDRNMQDKVYTCISASRGAQLCARSWAWLSVAIKRH